MSLLTAPQKSDVRGSRARFLAVFGGIIGVYYLLTAIPWVDVHIIFPVLKLSARWASSLLNLAGAETVCHGVVVKGSTFAVAVRRGCDPFEPIALFAAGVLAFPAPWNKRLVGLIAGAVALFLLNLLRIASLYFLGSRQAGYFEAIHQEWWPALFILAALAMWGLWLFWTRRSTAPQNA